MNPQEWAAKALVQAVERVYDAAPGARNNTLTLATLDAADYVRDGTLSHGAARDALVGAAVAIGLTPSESAKTVDSNLRRGRSAPWYPSSGGPRPRRTTTTPVARGATACPAPGVRAPDPELTEYPHVRATEGTRYVSTWDSVWAVLSHPWVPEDGELPPLWHFARLRGDSRAATTATDGTRAEAVVEAVYALCLDYDADAAFAEEYLAEKLAGYVWYGHTTKSHMTAKGEQPPIARGRAIIPLARPVTHDEYRKIVAWVGTQDWGEYAQPELVSPARIYYQPLATPEYACWRGEGDPIDVDAIFRLADRVELPEKAKATPAILDKILREDGLYRNRIQWDLHAGCLRYRGGIAEDYHLTGIMVGISENYNMTYTANNLHAVAESVAREHTVHPLRDWLRGLRWDGRERLPGLMADYFGADPSDGVARLYGAPWLVSAVARVMRDDSTKVDTMLVLLGSQGAGKSSGIRALFGGKYVCDSELDIGNKDAPIAMRGKWVAEIAEQSSFRGRSAEQLKAFLSSPEDVYRPPYGRISVTIPRQWVVVATTNDPEVYDDPTGARRYWIVRVADPIDVAGIERDRDQLWAEAVARYDRGDPWWLVGAEAEAQAASVAEYHRSDAWESTLEAWVHTPSARTAIALHGGLELAETVALALEIPPGLQTPQHTKRAAGVLRRLGWEVRQTRVNGRKRRVWAPVEILSENSC